MALLSSPFTFLKISSNISNFMLGWRTIFLKIYCIHEMNGRRPQKMPHMLNYVILCILCPMKSIKKSYTTLREPMKAHQKCFSSLLHELRKVISSFQKSIDMHNHKRKYTYWMEYDNFLSLAVSLYIYIYLLFYFSRRVKSDIDIVEFWWWIFSHI